MAASFDGTASHMIEPVPFLTIYRMAEVEIDGFLQVHGRRYTGKRVRLPSAPMHWGSGVFGSVLCDDARRQSTAGNSAAPQAAPTQRMRSTTFPSAPLSAIACASRICVSGTRLAMGMMRRPSAAARASSASLRESG
jgi:hypothetical protein